MTNVAAALNRAPDIADKIVVLWNGGGPYPEGSEGEFNLLQDADACRALLASRAEVWQIPQNVYGLLEVSLAELGRPCAPLRRAGRISVRPAAGGVRPRILPRHHLRSGENWTLGDNTTIAVLLSTGARWHMQSAPRILPDRRYAEDPAGRPIRVYDWLSARLTLEDLFAKLNLAYGEQNRMNFDITQVPFSCRGSYLALSQNEGEFGGRTAEPGLYLRTVRGRGQRPVPGPADAAVRRPARRLCAAGGPGLPAPGRRWGGHRHRFCRRRHAPAARPRGRGGALPRLPQRGPPLHDARTPARGGRGVLCSCYVSRTRLVLRAQRGGCASTRPGTSAARTTPAWPPMSTGAAWWTRAVSSSGRRCTCPKLDVQRLQLGPLL